MLQPHQGGRGRCLCPSLPPVSRGQPAAVRQETHSCQGHRDTIHASERESPSSLSVPAWVHALLFSLSRGAIAPRCRLPCVLSVGVLRHKHLPACEAMAAPEQAPQAQEGVEFELDLSALVDGRLPDHLLQQLSQGADVTLPPQATPGPGEGAQGPTSRPPGDQEQRADKADDGQSSGSASASLAAAVERLSQLSAPTRHGADVLHTVDGDTLPTRRQPASPPAPHQEASLRRSEAHEGEDTPSDPGAALWARSQGWQARREAKLASLRAAKEEAEAAEVKGGFQPRLAQLADAHGKAFLIQSQGRMAEKQEQGNQ